MAVLGDKVVGASSIEGAVRECDLLIVATGWPEYKEIDPAWCKRDGQRLTVLDLWRTRPPTSSPQVADLAVSRLRPLEHRALTRMTKPASCGLFHALTGEAAAKALVESSDEAALSNRKLTTADCEIGVIE